MQKNRNSHDNQILSTTLYDSKNISILFYVSASTDTLTPANTMTDKMASIRPARLSETFLLAISLLIIQELLFNYIARFLSVILHSLAARFEVVVTVLVS